MSILGRIQQFASDYAPQEDYKAGSGRHLCDGSILQANEYQEL